MTKLKLIWIPILLILIFFNFAFAASDSVNVSLTVTAGSTGGGGDDEDPPCTINCPPTPVLGCTDPSATNYNSSATQNDGSCTYPVTGCTDSNASNYNSSATTDDGSCTYPVENINNFSASYNSGSNSINLSWSNPSFVGFQSVRIVRSSSSFPTSPTSGQLIYQGTAESFEDTDIDFDTTYYYTAFVRNNNGDYSSGSVDSASVPSEDESPLPPGEDPPPLPGEEGGPPDPFDSFPVLNEITDPLILDLTFGDFIFSQPGERRQFFSSGGTVYINGNKTLTVSVPYDKVPETLKIIGLSIRDPEDRRKIFSFLLKINEDKSSYEATIAPLGRDGKYEIYVSIINYQDQNIKRLSGELLVSGVGLTTLGAMGDAVGKVSSPIVISTGLAIGVAQGLAFGSITSLYDVYLLGLKLFGLILSFLGIKKKSRSWGVVYDSVTKRPLDPAYVIVRQGEDDKGTAITDLDGRYGFFLKGGKYTLFANKTHYEFPSKKLAGKQRDELYSDLYHGEVIETSDADVINRNIPMDPVAFDWNEFAKNQQGFFVLNSKKERLKKRIFGLIRWAGFLLSCYNAVFYPAALNLGVFIMYIVVFSFTYFFANKHKVLTVRSQNTGLPLAFAIIKVMVPGVDQLVKSVVADEMGRFFILTPPGQYYITVDEKQPDESYKQVYRSEPKKLEKGVLDEDILTP